MVLWFYAKSEKEIKSDITSDNIFYFSTVFLLSKMNERDSIERKRENSESIESHKFSLCIMISDHFI